MAHGLFAVQAAMAGSGWTGEVRPLARFGPQFRRIRRNRKRKPATSHWLRAIHSKNSLAIN